MYPIKVTSCFYFVPLRIGCILIGLVFIVVNLLEFLRGVQNLLNWEKQEQNTATVEQRSNMLLGAAIRLAINVAWVLVGILLIVAVLRNQKNWLKNIVIFVVVCTSGIFLFGIIHFILATDYLVLICLTVVFVLFMYFALVVWSYYRSFHEVITDDVFDRQSDLNEAS